MAKFTYKETDIILEKVLSKETKKMLDEQGNKNNTFLVIDPVTMQPYIKQNLTKEDSIYLVGNPIWFRNYVNKYWDKEAKGYGKGALTEEIYQQVNAKLNRMEEVLKVKESVKEVIKDKGNKYLVSINELRELLNKYKDVFNIGVERAVRNFDNKGRKPNEIYNYYTISAKNNSIECNISEEMILEKGYLTIFISTRGLITSSRTKTENGKLGEISKTKDDYVDMEYFLTELYEISEKNISKIV